MLKSKLIKDKKYPEMYRVQWPDGEVSDMVNKTRAKDAIRRYEEYERRYDIGRVGGGSTEPAGAFK